MEQEKTFKTKTGYCHILPDKIVLTRNNTLGTVTKGIFGNNMARVLTIYGVFTTVFLYSGFEAYQNGQIAKLILYGIIAIFLIYGIAMSVNNSANPIIYRANIIDVKFKRARQGLTRSRFEVIFENDHGKIKKRLILLPGSLNNGQSETKKAITLMRQEKLLKQSFTET